MTEQLYYRDNRKTEFTARVLSVEPGAEGAAGARLPGKGCAVELDQTCFYPEGGGQPADRGTLSGIPVVDVRKIGGRILHYLAGAPEGDEVAGRIDWARRLHFMQQHTGQHIVSAALKRVSDIDTVSVHLGEETTTVEVAAAEVSAEKLERIEEKVNVTVCRNLPVRTRWVDESEVPGLSLRRPTERKGRIRVVEIPGFDRAACGGVHVSSTGEVRLIKHVEQEKIRGHARLHWMIGSKAMADYRLKTELLRELVTELSAQPREIPERVRKLQEEIRDAAAARKDAEERLASLTAESLLAEAER